MNKLIEHLSQSVFSVIVTKVDRDTNTEIDKQEVVIMNVGALYLVVIVIHVVLYLEGY